MPRFAQRFAWWWPLTLAAFALAAFAAIALASGTAHADDGSPPPPAGESQSAKSPGSEKHRSPTASLSDADPSPTQKNKDGASKPSTVRHLSTSPKKAKRSADIPTPKPEDAPTTEPSTPKVSKAPKAEAPTSVATEKPRGTRRFSQHDPDPEPAAVQSATKPGSRTDQPVAATRTAAAPNNVVALPNPVSPSPITATPEQQFTQFVRQIVGLASDAGIVGASLVNNLALQAAAIIGPEPFFGVPYTVATAVAETAANVSKLLSGTPLDATSAGRFTVDYAVLDVLSFFTPTKVPAGANDPSIKVSAEHPLPVILLNGTIESQALNWSVGAPVLANAGYKVYSFNYGNITPYPDYPIQSTADIRLSAAELAGEIARVLKETGAPKVILVGHSQGGGILPAYYLNELGGSDKVSQLIGLAPSNHGTDFDGLVALQGVPIFGPLLFGLADLIIGPALGQQLVTSPFQQVVYGDGDTQSGVRYTTIASTNDEVVTPYTQQALDGPGVSNIVLQNMYPGLPTGHIGVAFSSQAWANVLDALTANAEANPLQDSVPTAA